MLLKLLRRTPARAAPATRPSDRRPAPSRGAGLRINGSIVLALLMAAAIGLWMSTGTVVVGGQESAGSRTPPPAERIAAADTPFRVRVRTIDAVERPQTLLMRGRTEAEARVEVKAETSGRIAERPVRKGDEVAPGDLLCRLDPGARRAQLLQAEALAAKAALEHKGATRLLDKGFESETRVAATKAALDAADAAVAEARLDLERTSITAPIAGIVEEPLAEIGETLSVGGVCAMLIDTDPMLVIGQVSERDIARLTVDRPAEVKLVTGETVEGRIRHVSRVADPDTRTFTVEIEIANPQRALRDGVTAEATIPLPPVRAHRLSPGVLTLADDGRLGVRAVDEEGTVMFLPVTLLGQDGDGVWVAGLPERTTVIVVGQEYVVEGQRVEPVHAEAGAAS